jgi:hypothetical protein
MTLSCKHMQIGNIKSGSCSICGPLKPTSKVSG